MRKAVIIGYFILLHLALGFMLWESDVFVRAKKRPPVTSAAQEITDHYRRMLRYHQRMDGNVPDRSVVFIGDSLIQGLCTDAVSYPSVNYGIGSDTTVGVLARLPEYQQSLRRASAVVLAIGVNDMKFRDNQQIVENCGRILHLIPEEVPVVWSALLPISERTYNQLSIVNNSRIVNLNASLKKLSITNPRCVFVDPYRRLVDENGNLSAELEDGDGIHLNSIGNSIWIDELRSGLRKAQHGPSDVSQASGLPASRASKADRIAR